MADLRFEARLADALRAYADTAPVEVDPVEMATAAARAAGPASRWAEVVGSLRFGSGRFAILLATLLLLLAIAIAALVGSGLFHPPPLPPSQLGFVETGPMAMSRHGLVAVRLQDGRVLAIGGHTPDLGAGFEVSYASSEIWDPRTGLFSLTGSMTVPRLLFQATPLDDGKVLVEGGDPSTGATAGAELFDPATGTWSPTGSMAGPRRMHSATLLANGQVLVAGGHDGQEPLATAELYDPATGTFRPAGSLPQPTWLQSAVRLDDGNALVAGGLGADGNPTAAAALYNAATGAWTPTGSMPVARVGPVLTRLADGRVLAFATDGIEADLYDPRTRTFAPTGSMRSPHTTATLLGDGRVLVAGGGSEAELYDPGTGTFSPTQSLNAADPVDAAVPLLNGKVLLVRGGAAPSELFDPGIAHTMPAPPAPGSSAPGPAAPTPPDACSLLTSAEVSAIRGVPAGPGDPSNGSAGTPDCQWPPESGDGDPLVDISIFSDDPRLWRSLSTNSFFTPTTIQGYPALVSGDVAQAIWVEVPRYVVHVNVLSPQPNGRQTPDREQQLEILDRILSRLR
jgi:hypothetical protein